MMKGPTGGGQEPSSGRMLAGYVVIVYLLQLVGSYEKDSIVDKSESNPHDAAQALAPPDPLLPSSTPVQDTASLVKDANGQAFVRRDTGKGFQYIRFDPDALSAQDVSFAIMTGAKYHRERADGVKETWCRSVDCTFFSDSADAHLDTVVVEAPHDYAGAQLRFLPALSWMKTNKPASKWVFLVDDDTFVFVKNLRVGLSSFSPDTPMQIGLVLHPSSVAHVKHNGRDVGPQAPFVAGGGGVAFSAAAMRQMNIGNCITHQGAGKSWEGWQSDWMVGQCASMYGVTSASDYHFVQWPHTLRGGNITDPITIHQVTSLSKMRSLCLGNPNSTDARVTSLTLSKQEVAIPSMFSHQLNKL